MILLVTGALYLTVGAFRWTLRGALLLVAAIFIHECGHLAAMKWCRYKNLKMLFIPFLGAVASGQSDEQDACKIATISIAGPLVGLLVGGLAVLSGLLAHNDVLIGFAYQSVLLNGFNLLPILPLDGGHIVNELLLAKFPKIEACFKGAAAVALLAWAAKTGAWALGGIGVFLLMTLKVSYGMAAAGNRLRDADGMRGGGLTEEKVSKIRDEILAANPEIVKPGNPERLPRAIASMWANINKNFPSRQTATLFLAGYLVVLLTLVPIGLLARRAIRGDHGAAAVNAQGNVKLAKGDAEGAISDYNKAIALSPADPVLYINRGIARYLKGDLDGGIADLNSGLARRSDDATGLYFRGRAKAAKGDFTGAISDYDLAVQLKADDPYYFVHRGFAKTRVGVFDGATRDLERAIALNAKNGDAWSNRGYLRDLYGDFAGAAQYYETAAALLPKADFIRFHWALVLRRQSADESRVGLEAAIQECKYPWTRTIGDFLVGRLTEEDFLRKAGTGGAQREQRRQCQAFYYAGMIHLVRKEFQPARDLLAKSIATNAIALDEFGLARAELARIDAPRLPTEADRPQATQP
jgi:Flp pilus assembly protein TadD/Zn-dependent protease